MSNFIKNYLDELKNSDEATKHRSAMTISIILSIIILSIAFTLLRNNLFDFSKDDTNMSSYKEDSKNEVVSPFQSIKNFFSQTGREFSNVKSTINTSIKGDNSTTSTSSINIINYQESTSSTSTLIDNASPKSD